MTKILHISNGTFLTVSSKDRNHNAYTDNINLADMEQYDRIHYYKDPEIPFYCFMDYFKGVITQTSYNDRLSMPFCVRNNILNVYQMIEFEIIND